MQKNDYIEIDITDIGSDGEGIGHYKEDKSGCESGLTIFVKNSVPGDRIRAKVMKIKKNYAFARVEEVLKESPSRVIPFCPVADKCGGCQLQRMKYEEQLRFKENKVREDLIRLGGISAEKIRYNDDEKAVIAEDAGDVVAFGKIIGMEKPVRYRNKGQFPVGCDKEGNIICGFYAGHTHSVIHIDDCGIQAEITAPLMAAVRSYMEKAGVRPYDEATGKGLVRHVLTRVGFATGEVMVCVVINGKKLPKEDVLIAELRSAFEKSASPCIGQSADESMVKNCKLTSVSYSVNMKDTNVIMGEEVVTIYGEPVISDYIGDVRYQISPLSFYQVNPVQTRKLYSTALEFAELSGNEVVWDLYCGIGTISLFLAKKAGHVYGVEIVPEAIEDAKRNATLNKIENAEFFVGAAEEVLPKKYRENPSMRADVIVVDPPRKGLDGRVIDCIASLEPKRVVYVSCDPATLSRDVAIFREKGYELKKVQTVDMFPMSVHVETVVLMSNVKWE